jgi:alkyl sulfatase BDS1-like metallo-beta-lactamase superfamily hydrolase
LWNQNGLEIEIHLKSSDWYVHHHERDEAYENVIFMWFKHDWKFFRKIQRFLFKLKNTLKMLLQQTINLCNRNRGFSVKQIKEIDAFAFKTQDVCFF